MISPGMTVTVLCTHPRALKNADVPMSYFTGGKSLLWHCNTQYNLQGGENDQFAEHVGDVVFFDSKTVG